MTREDYDNLNARCIDAMTRLAREEAKRRKLAIIIEKIHMELLDQLLLDGDARYDKD